MMKYPASTTMFSVNLHCPKTVFIFGQSMITLKHKERINIKLKIADIFSSQDARDAAKHSYSISINFNCNIINWPLIELLWIE